MQINRLELYTDDLETQLYFYKRVLGMPIIRISADQFGIITHKTEFVFTRCSFPVNYHFAFLIDDFYFMDALHAVRKTRVPMIPDTSGNDIIEWDEGRSFYFRDGDNNIGEFITRPDTGTESTIDGDWDFTQILSVNEIGVPVTNPADKAAKWIGDYQLDVPSRFRNSFSDTFCWTGDHSGALLVVEKEREWHLTGTRAVSSPLNIGLQTTHGARNLRFEGGLIRVLLDA